ncbi:MAG: pyridoxine 5'-phosphate synthase, partial [Verrucomicrobia bacterium]|nr:pyridoxine 5'-phosphate synthase [Verrucomicrobiota bacterium]
AEEAEVQRLITAANQAHQLGLKVNAGHGINYTNIRQIYRIPHLVELNIGHSIISRSVTVGIVQAVQEMLGLMKEYKL